MGEQGHQACFHHPAQELRENRSELNWGSKGEQVNSEQHTELTWETQSHVLATKWCRLGFGIFLGGGHTIHMQCAVRASLTWVVVWRRFVQHDSVFCVRAHQWQNQSCININDIFINNQQKIFM